jgi:WD40 repeat protein
MAKFGNENILKLVFISITLTHTKQLVNRILNKTISKILILLITYEAIFKNLGRVKTILDEENEDSIKATALLPNGIVIVAHDDGIFKFWDMKNHKCLYSENKLIVKSIQVLPGGDLLTLNENQDIIQLWKIVNGYKYICYKIIKSSEFKECFSDILLLPNGNIMCATYIRFLTNFIDIQVFDYKDKYKSFISMTGHRDLVEASVNLDGNKFATACIDILIWDIDNDYSCVKVLKGHEDGIASLFYIEKDKLLLSGSYDKKMIIWDMVSYNQSRVISMHSVVMCFLNLPNRYIALGYLVGSVGFMDLNGFKCINKVEAHENEILSLMLLEDNKVLSSSADETIVWEV